MSLQSQPSQLRAHIYKQALPVKRTLKDRSVLLLKDYVAASVHIEWKFHVQVGVGW
jgi:hypothetical protein